MLDNGVVPICMLKILNSNATTLNNRVVLVCILFYSGDVRSTKVQPSCQSLT